MSNRKRFTDVAEQGYPTAVRDRNCLGSTRRGPVRKTKREITAASSLSALLHGTLSTPVTPSSILVQSCEFISHIVFPCPFLVWLYLKIPIAQQSRANRIVVVTV